MAHQIPHWHVQKNGTRPTEPPRLVVEPSKIDPYVDRADLILVTHGHFDHMADVPYIAAKTGAPVLGTVSHVNMLRALDHLESYTP